MSTKNGIQAEDKNPAEDELDILSIEWGAKAKLLRAYINKQNTKLRGSFEKRSRTMQWLFVLNIIGSGLLVIFIVAICLIGLHLMNSNSDQLKEQLSALETKVAVLETRTPITVAVGPTSVPTIAATAAPILRPTLEQTIVTRTPSPTSTVPTKTPTSPPAPALVAGKHYILTKPDNLKASAVDDPKQTIISQVPVTNTFDLIVTGTIKSGYAQVSLEVWVAKQIVGQPDPKNPASCKLMRGSPQDNKDTTSTEAVFTKEMPTGEPQSQGADSKLRELAARLEQGAFSTDYSCIKVLYPSEGQWAKIQIIGWLKAENLQEIKP